MGGQGNAESENAQAAEGGDESVQKPVAVCGGGAVVVRGGHEPGGEPAAVEGEEADAHQRQREAQAEDQNRIERADHDVRTDAQQHDDRRGRTGHKAAGDAQQKKHPPGNAIRLAVVMVFIGVRMRMIVQVFMVFMVRGRMVVVMSVRMMMVMMAV